MPCHGQKQREQLSYLKFVRWLRGRTLTRNFSGSWVQSAMHTFFLWARPMRRTSIEVRRIDATEKTVRVLVICHTHELAYQIKHEFDRFSKYFAEVKTGIACGDVPIAKDREMLQESFPHVLIGTSGRVLGLLRDKDLKLDKLSQFMLDECDKCLDKLDRRKDVQQIFIETSKKKQVMMFSATMTSETRVLCMRFMSDPHEIGVDEESKLVVFSSVIRS